MAAEIIVAGAVAAGARAVLGKDYDRLGKRLVQRLRGDLPPAVAVRVPRAPD